MPKKILHIFGIMNRGGAELRTLSTMDYMIKNNISYEFVVLSGQKGVLDEEIIANGGIIHYCKLDKSFLKRFSNILHIGNYDAIHSHVSLASGLMVFVAWFHKIKIRIAHFRSTKDVENPSFVRKTRDLILRRLILIFSTNVVGVCYASLNAFWGEHWNKNKKFSVIYNGFPQVKVELHDDFWSSYIPNYSGQKVILNVARMDTPKNHPRMLKIFAELCKKNNDVLLVLVGKEEPEIKHSLEKIAANNKIENKVYYLNEKENVIPFLSHANVMLFPSIWEGLPGAVIESISAGTEVVGSSIPGVVEISTHMHFVTPLSLLDSNEQWAIKLMAKIVKNRSKREIKEQFDRSTFQIENNLERLYELYTISK